MKKYTWEATQIFNGCCAERELVVYANNNKEAFEKVKALDDDTWENNVIIKIEEVREKD